MYLLNSVGTWYLPVRLVSGWNYCVQGKGEMRITKIMIVVKRVPPGSCASLPINSWLLTLKGKQPTDRDECLNLKPVVVINKKQVLQ